MFTLSHGKIDIYENKTKKKYCINYYFSWPAGQKSDDHCMVQEAILFCKKTTVQDLLKY
jgi:hypothetical protein